VTVTVTHNYLKWAVAINGDLSQQFSWRTLPAFDSNTAEYMQASTMGIIIIIIYSPNTEYICKLCELPENLLTKTSAQN
jgi:hypothetical protein